METRLGALEVRVHGRPVREYHHNGEIWIEGKKVALICLLNRRRDSRLDSVIKGENR